MYKIVRKQELNASVTLMEIEAPFVARKAKAGQFIIFRIDEMGERVPLTIAGYDREKGTVTIIFQKVGFSTNALGALKEGDYIHDFVGPFGVHTMVSLNPIMVDGTGMCGGCRVTVGGETKFACVDGPEFDGHQVDFAELTSRNGTYRDREAEVKENHVCRIESMGKALIK